MKIPSFLDKMTKTWGGTAAARSCACEGNGLFLALQGSFSVQKQMLENMTHITVQLTSSAVATKRFSFFQQIK